MLPESDIDSWARTLGESGIRLNDNLFPFLKTPYHFSLISLQ